MEMEIAVSIIIPTFNEERYLPKLLTSIKKQTVQPKEIIVADALSSDQTRHIAKKFGCVVIDGGPPAIARNLGAKHATQPLLLFLDADVVLPKRFLQTTTEEMQERKLDIASCYVSPISTQKIDKMLHNFVNYYIKITNKFRPHIPGACIFVKRSLHKKINGFDESLILAEDHDYVQRTSKYGTFSYLKTYKIPMSVRRLTEEGRLNLAIKYISVELHLLLIGQVKKGFFEYKYGEHLND